MAAKTDSGASVPILTRKDFATDLDPRWCPGCGDYSVLRQMQNMLPDLGVPREKMVFISGIGCSSRFPYYMETYGIHGIHGRAPALATGLKVARPDLQVWVITGDGDGLSIGGNHLIHALRRNIDLNIVLFNNRVYGLTKGQYSPTSLVGQTTKSSPTGTIEAPINPLELALAAQATFVARSFDTDPQHLQDMLEAAARHKGVSFVEVYQNCNIFNDGAFRDFTDKPVRKQRLLYLEAGKPMVYGDNNELGIRLNGFKPETVSLEGGHNQALVHNPAQEDPTLAFILSRMNYPEMPVPMGVLRDVAHPTYEAQVEEQVAAARARRGPGDLQALVTGEAPWRVL